MRRLMPGRQTSQWLNSGHGRAVDFQGYIPQTVVRGRRQRRSVERARLARPGQFVHVRVTGMEATALRRPFSICGVEDNRLSLLYKTVGRGTEQLSRLRPDDAVSVMGPLGNGFPLSTEGQTPVLVAGGYGVAPLAFLARRLPSRGVALIGGRTADDILCTSDFETLGWEVRIATMDGSRGADGKPVEMQNGYASATGLQYVPSSKASRQGAAPPAETAPRRRRSARQESPQATPSADIAAAARSIL